MRRPDGVSYTCLATRLRRPAARTLRQAPRNPAQADGGSSATRRAKVAHAWSSASRVRCLTAAGAGVDSGFTLAATSGDGSGYALGNRPTTASYVAGDAFANVPGTSASPTITRFGVGRYGISFVGAPANLGGNVQVTAYGNTRNHCKVASWSATVAEVLCLSPAGAPEDTQFAVRFVDPLDAGRRVEVALRELRGASADPCGTMNMSGALSFVSGASGSAAIPLATGAVRRFAPAITVAGTSRPGQRYVDVQLAIRDEDPDPICGTDDTVDLVPRSGAETLRVRIDLQAHTVQMLDAEPPVLGGLGTWWSDGRDGDETGKAELEVEIMSPFGIT